MYGKPKAIPRSVNRERVGNPLMENQLINQSNKMNECSNNKYRATVPQNMYKHNEVKDHKVQYRVVHKEK